MDMDREIYKYIISRDLCSVDEATKSLISDAFRAGAMHEFHISYEDNYADQVLSFVEDISGYSIEDLKCKYRGEEVVYARVVVVKLLRDKGFTFQKIASILNRGTSNVQHLLKLHDDYLSVSNKTYARLYKSGYLFTK